MASAPHSKNDCHDRRNEYQQNHKYGDDPKGMDGHDAANCYTRPKGTARPARRGIIPDMRYFGYVGPRAMIVSVGVIVIGLALKDAGMLSDDRTLQGVGVLLALCGLGFAVAIAIRWLWYRGVG